MASYLKLDGRMTGRPGSGVFLFLYEISVQQYYIGAFCLILYRFYAKNIFQIIKFHYQKSSIFCFADLARACSRADPARTGKST